MLTKAEVEERLPKTLGRSVYEGTATREREALETALALYAVAEAAKPMVKSPLDDSWFNVCKWCYRSWASWTDAKGHEQDCPWVILDAALAALEVKE